MYYIYIYILITRAILSKMTHVQSANFAVGHFCRPDPFQKKKKKKKKKKRAGHISQSLNENEYVGNGKWQMGTPVGAHEGGTRGEGTRDT